MKMEKLLPTIKQTALSVALHLSTNDIKHRLHLSTYPSVPSKKVNGQRSK